MRGVGREVISLFVYNLCTVTRKKAHFLLIKKKERSWGWGILRFCKKYQNLLLSLILGKSEQRPPRSWGSFPLPPPSPRLLQQGRPSPWGEWGVRQHSPGGGDKGHLGWTAGCWPRQEAWNPWDGWAHNHNDESNIACLHSLNPDNGFGEQTRPHPGESMPQPQSLFRDRLVQPRSPSLSPKKR